MFQLFGTIKPPQIVEKYGSAFGSQYGLITFLSNLLKLVMIIAGLWAVVSIILAGFQFVYSQGDPKQVTDAQAKIWNSLIGLIIIVSSFTLAAIFGWILFGDPSAILNPRVYGPGE